ncbi:hypothetical protein EIP91_012439 [Steccherinum ochraceum]|uniref:BTB domain-containing protein n=1 Tax=Steccherinum ochraceum TaxID=92696 RepID=A0A4R0RWW6_9APHY|nr:hypothetical protein EIP91_012439 [Steccherinum ochraceum]
MAPSVAPAPVVSKDALPPFNKPNADIILRSSDNVDFRVHKFMLSEASPAFEDMFAAPSGSLNADEHRDGLPVVHVTESSKVLDAILRCCYPVVAPQLESADTICEALDAAKKFMMERAIKEFKEQFTRHAEKEPHAMYSFAARRFEWDEEILVAARACLRFPFDPIQIPGMQRMDPLAYQRLHVYHLKCGQAQAQIIVDGPEDSDAIYSTSFLSERDLEALLRTRAGTHAHMAENASDFTTLLTYCSVTGEEAGAEVRDWLIRFLKYLASQMRHRPHLDVYNFSSDETYGGSVPCCATCQYNISEILSLIVERQASVANFQRSIDTIKL